jgi:hypothetical protein
MTGSEARRRERFRIARHKRVCSDPRPALSRIVHSRRLATLIRDRSFQRKARVLPSARSSEDGVALVMLVPQAEQGRRDHRLPARVATRCWITSEAVTSTFALFRSRVGSSVTRLTHLLCAARLLGEQCLGRIDRAGRSWISRDRQRCGDGDRSFDASVSATGGSDALGSESLSARSGRRLRLAPVPVLPVRRCASPVKPG